MANELKIFYSSGNAVENTYGGETRKSIGGLITGTQVPATLRNLFGTISLKSLAEGSTDFRLVYLSNTGIASPAQDISLLRWYVDVPILAIVTDPADLVAPNVGDKYIVPPNAEGLWKIPSTFDPLVNTVEGKKATYNGTGWDFTFAPFAVYEFGFIAPTDVILKIDKIDTPISFVTTIDNVFEPPAGVTFISADTLANETTIGSGVLAIGDDLAMWIKRTIAPFDINKEDLVVDEGGIVLDELIPIEFAYSTP